MTYQNIFCIVAADQLLDLTSVDMPLAIIAHNSLQAVVSETQKARARPSRANILKHQAVNELVMAQVDAVLPMRFGTIADSEEALITKVLAAEAEPLLQFLDSVRNKHEVSASVKWPEERLLEEVRRRMPEWVTEAEQAQDINSKINLGKKIEALTITIHDELTQKLLEAVGPHIADHRLNERRDATESVNAAFLVDNDQQIAFEAAVERFSTMYPDDAVFKIVSPLPAYSFVELTINLEEGE